VLSGKIKCEYSLQMKVFLVRSIGRNFTHLQMILDSASLIWLQLLQLLQKETRRNCWVIFQ